MKFSIIIPTYNYAHYLSRAIDSILSQAFQEIELIIIDDGSTDHTAEIVHSYQTKIGYIKYVYQKNQGPAKARNYGLKLAQGDYILMLDADDELTPGSLQQFFEATLRYPLADGFLCPHLSQQINGKIKQSHPATLSQNKEINFLNYIQAKISIGAGSFLLKKSAWKNLSYPENIKGREDTVVFALIFALFNLETLSQPSVITHRHQYSLRSQTQSHIGQNEVVSSLFDHILFPKQLQKYRSLYESLLYLSLFRSFLLAKDKKTARHYYWLAVKCDWKQIFNWTYTRKYLRTLL